MIEGSARTHGTIDYIVTCDGCGILELLMDCYDISHCVLRLKRDNWTVKRAAGEYMHFCVKCNEKENLNDEKSKEQKQVWIHYFTGEYFLAKGDTETEYLTSNCICPAIEGYDCDRLTWVNGHISRS